MAAKVADPLEAAEEEEDLPEAVEKVEVDIPQADHQEVGAVPQPAKVARARPRSDRLATVTTSKVDSSLRASAEDLKNEHVR